MSLYMLYETSICSNIQVQHVDLGICQVNFETVVLSHIKVEISDQLSIPYSPHL